VYRLCIASFEPKLWKKDLKHKDDFEPYWQDEKDWLCIVEFLRTDNPEARRFASDIIAYLIGYANLTNTPLAGTPRRSRRTIRCLSLLRSERIWKSYTLEA
jgi:hypothetical protein